MALFTITMRERVNIKGGDSIAGSFRPFRIPCVQDWMGVQKNNSFADGGSGE